jgi:hypothetical protein
VDNGTWQSSGATVSDLSVGSHTVSFSTITGWNTPINENVTIGNGSTTPASGTYTQQTGYLQVSIYPSGAVNAGAQWQENGGAWQNNGTTITLPVGNYTVSFNTIAGWNTPGNQNVTINNGSTTTPSATYTPQTGSLQVTISPSSAVSAGAQWQVDNGAWQSSGATVSGLTVGNHTVDFNAISGWSSPGAQTVQINNGQTTPFTGTYTTVNGSLQVTITPSGAVTAGAQWQVDNGAWQSSGAIVSGLSVGNHTVSFNTISGWNTPNGQTVSITANQTTPLTGTYSQVQTPQLSVSPTSILSASGFQGGPFTPSNIQYAVNNGATGTLNWTVSADQPWVAVSQSSGQNTGTVTVSINTNANALLPNTYHSTLTFGGNGGSTNFPVELTIIASSQFFIFPPCINGLQVNINGGTYPPTGAEVTNIVLNWGDGQQTSGYFPNNHTYASAGNYTIQVTSEYSDGSSATLSQAVSPAPGVVVNCVACEIAANQGGAVSYQASVGSGTVTAGTSVTLQEAYAADLFLTANPSGNDFFVNWSPSSGMTGVNATPIATNSPSVTIVVDNDSQIIANFSSLLLAVGSPPLGSNGINLLLYAPAGSNVVVQVSTDLVNWYAWTNLTVPYSPYPISDASVTNSIARFYRAVIPTMADNFTSDNSLNSSLWAANSSILSTLAANITSPSATLETPIFTFDSAGMQMTGVNGTYQFAGVQSLNTFAPPFTVNTTVMGTQSPGNAFAVLLVNSNLNQWLCILGDLIPQTCNQNVWINYTGSGNPLSNNGKSLYGNPSLGVFYTIQISVGTNGYASVVLMTNGVTLASGSGLSVGDGPFYVVLGQKEGLPCVSGPLAATWQTISVTSPP